MPFEFIKLDVKDMQLIIPKVFNDERGFFLESFKKSDFAANGILDDFRQDNHSKSAKGVLRGLHYQTAPKAQAKIVRCIKGKIFDVGVDIRKSSPTYKKWAGAILSEENKNMLYLPEGFAHGFVVLSDTAEILYKASNEYSKEHDRGIAWNDPDININWGINFEPGLSEKDKNQPFLKDIEEL
ncbi:MAG: dTDP-4-dehydrorhamnose 3,5-epimerase [Candidatus Gastranaerophilales bacterium]|nr:dTDP-4-dehydrorhamnose 3,5-epimerase [Candidatus Gastranaerophilales bacterium]